MHLISLTDESTETGSGLGYRDLDPDWATETWIRIGVPRPGPGLGYRDLDPDWATETWIRNGLPRPGSGFGQNLDPQHCYIHPPIARL